MAFCALIYVVMLGRDGIIAMLDLEMWTVCVLMYAVVLFNDTVIRNQAETLDLAGFLRKPETLAKMSRFLTPCVDCMAESNHMIIRLPKKVESYDSA